MFYGAIVGHCTIHVKLLLLALVLRQEQEGVNIKQHNVLELVFVVFSISVEKRNSSSSELVKLVFLVLYFFVVCPPNIIILYYPPQMSCDIPASNRAAAALQLYGSILLADYCQEGKYSLNKLPPWWSHQFLLFQFGRYSYYCNFQENGLLNFCQILLKLAICVTDAWEWSAIGVNKNLKMLPKWKE